MLAWGHLQYAASLMSAADRAQQAWPACFERAELSQLHQAMTLTLDISLEVGLATSASPAANLHHPWPC